MNNQICLTAGDMQRISRFLGREDFHTVELIDQEYVDQSDDPVWTGLTVTPDGRRWALKRTTERNCIFLTDTGCRLPWHVRPLICRIHPFTYQETGVSGIDPTCPISGDPDWPATLDELGMTFDRVKEWHRMLYCELREAQGFETKMGERPPEEALAVPPPWSVQSVTNEIPLKTVKTL